MADAKQVQHGSDEIAVTVTSVDGNLTQAFRRSDTVGDVHRVAYDKLVRDKTAVPFSATTIEFKGEAVSESEKLAVLNAQDEKGKPDNTLRLALTWVSQGG